MSARRRPLRTLLGLLAIGFVAYAVSFVCVLIVALQDEREPVDAIVVLGAAQYNGRPSPVLRARLDHAYDLWRDGMAPRIIVTGGMAAGDHESEAEVSAKYLGGRNVPTTQIVVTAVGRSTEESMTAVSAWMQPRGLSRVLLVSDPFHQLRLKLEARRTGLEALVSPTGTSPISDRPKIEMRFLLAEAFKVPVALVRSW